jgi:hypothetical protein
MSTPPLDSSAVSRPEPQGSDRAVESSDNAQAEQRSRMVDLARQFGDKNAELLERLSK